MARTIYLFRATYNFPNQHGRKLATQRLSNMGKLTPELFRAVVINSFNTVKDDRGYSLYSGILVGGKPHLIAKLYLVHSNKKKKTYDMFATFYKPDGELLRRKAGLPLRFFSKSDRDYPSRPPFNPQFNTKLMELVF